jgi:hypothetical protein
LKTFSVRPVTDAVTSSRPARSKAAALTWPRTRRPLSARAALRAALVPTRALEGDRALTSPGRHCHFGRK